jgi:hypothetical protein
MEMITKIIAKCYVFEANAYLKNGWNVLDCFLVHLSIAEIIFGFYAQENAKGFSILRVIRLVRVLRPLRAINRAPGLRLVVQTLISSLKPVSDVLITTSFFICMFAVLGLQVGLIDTVDVSALLTNFLPENFSKKLSSRKIFLTKLVRQLCHSFVQASSNNKNYFEDVQGKILSLCRKQFNKCNDKGRLPEQQSEPMGQPAVQFRPYFQRTHHPVFIFDERQLGEHHVQWD